MFSGDIAAAQLEGEAGRGCGRGVYSLGWIRIDCVDQTRFGLKRVFLPVSPECWVTDINHHIQLVIFAIRSSLAGEGLFKAISGALFLKSRYPERGCSLAAVLPLGRIGRVEHWGLRLRWIPTQACCAPFDRIKGFLGVTPSQPQSCL